MGCPGEYPGGCLARRCHRPRAWLWLIGWVWLCSASLLQAEESGYFVVRDVRSSLDQGVYLLDANIDFRFSEAALGALHSGLPLVLRIEIRVEDNRRWLWNEAVAVVNQLYRLQFHALSDRYLVHNLNTDTRQSYTTLADALYAVGFVRNFPVLDARLLDPGKTYFGRLRATLDVEELPTPMRLWAYVSDQWRLTSEWYRWQLSP